MSEPNTQLAVVDYGNDIGGGFENQRPEDFQIPLIALLQAQSPQVTGAKGKGIDGAKAGYFLNTVTTEVLGKEFLFVPATYEHAFCEYVPREQGGGFRGRYAVDDPAMAQALVASRAFKRAKTKDGNDLVETYYLFGVVCRGEDLQAVVIPFKSTNITQFRRWNSAVSSFMISGPGGLKQQPPLFAHLVKICAVSQSNKKGDFFNYVLEPAIDKKMASSLLPPGDPRFIAARALGKSILSGQAKAVEDTPAEDEPQDVF